MCLNSSNMSEKTENDYAKGIAFYRLPATKDVHLVSGAINIDITPDSVGFLVKPFNETDRPFLISGNDFIISNQLDIKNETQFYSNNLPDDKSKEHYCEIV